MTGHYGTAVDVYSIGVLVMEMAGLAPPATHSDRVALFTTRTDLANSITNGEVHWPCHQQHRPRSTFIPGFLLNLKTLPTLVITNVVVYNHVWERCARVRSSSETRVVDPE